MSDGPTLLRAGEVVGLVYELRSLIGRGARGEVWEAHDQALNRKVAVKLSARDEGGSLRREAQAIAAVRHTSMTAVHACGEHGDVEYFVMERLHGVSLGDFLETHRRGTSGEGAVRGLPLPEAYRIMTALADGLAAIHRGGIAHGDLKPDNVMLTPDQRVVLVDFGLFLAHADSESRRNFAGTPSYMAPELITADIERGAGHLVDLYALGVVIFEAFTGVRPFDGANVADTWKRHVGSPPPDLAALRPELPVSVVELVNELLAKNPRERTQNAEDVVQVLRRAASTPSSTRPAAKSEGASTNPPATFSVLVVDDDTDIARIIGFYVKQAIPDADVRTANDGAAALDALRARRADLMILDLQMPKMNGVEVCMFLRGSGIADDCTIACVSAGAQASDVELLQHMGVTRMIPKGVPDLDARIRDLVTDVRARKT